MIESTPPSQDNAEDTLLDQRLHQTLRFGSEPADEDFTRQVMAALPPRASRREQRWAEWPVQARFIAMGLAGTGVAAVSTVSDVQRDPAGQIALLTLIGLLALWAMPGRWNRA